MAQYGFLQTNQYRTYPFIDQEAMGELSVSLSYNWPLPDSVIVDVGFIMGPHAVFPEGSKIYLYEIRRTLDSFEIEFHNSASEADGPLIFTRAFDAAEFMIERNSTNGLIGELSLSECGDSIPLWEGFLITGDLSDLAELLPDFGDAITFEDMQYEVEPALIQNLSGSFLRSITLANYDRTHAIPPESCGGEEPEETPVYVNYQCITGDVRFMEGYNTSIRQDPSDGALVFSAAVGAGSGRACEEVPLYEDEEPPEGSTVLTGGPTCNNVIKTINGVGGRTVKIIGGDGITVRPHDTLPNTIVVSANLDDFPLCE